MSVKNLKNTIKVCLLFFVVLIFSISIVYVAAFKLATDYNIYSTYPIPHKVPSNTLNFSMERPWGNITNLTVFANLEVVGR